MYSLYIRDYLYISFLYFDDDVSKYTTLTTPHACVNVYRAVRCITMYVSKAVSFSGYLGLR